MAFKAPRRVFVLDFTDTELDGLTVKARSAPLGEFMRLGELSDTFEAADTEVDIKVMMSALGAMLEMFDQILLEWDLVDDDDQPIPPTAAGLATLDPAHAMAIITAWQTAVGSVPAPLPAASTAGSPSLAGSMPMEPLSESPAL